MRSLRLPRTVWERLPPGRRALVIDPYDNWPPSSGKGLFDPRAELRRTYAFLGIEDSFVPPKVQRVVNPAWRTKVEIPADIIDLLRIGYREDARALARDFPEIDLELWTTLATAG